VREGRGEFCWKGKVIWAGEMLVVVLVLVLVV
jgi:hypothetical protein